MEEGRDVNASNAQLQQAPSLPPVPFITSTAASNRHLPDACTSRDPAGPADDPAAPCLSFPSHRHSKGALGRLRSGVGRSSSALGPRHLFLQHLGTPGVILFALGYPSLGQQLRESRGGTGPMERAQAQLLYRLIGKL